MDGDVTNLEECQKYPTNVQIVIWVVDEAHSVGVFGDSSQG
jgi:7-keto-8-aminopelargonate synthetase-like enzyme